ncbi:Hpt domain-containing protein [Altererythrobacter aurantiacus]|uniref:Hpt domain-containing protein n=1 Tax=Parapontixanthobacter aurantiacus TaxID=1463599 RepID=A0A844ZDP7_9SPHN|nr:Hpt domain-containing protein [Parapontixanthobacter aurantiacus]MXO85382.1 Hpt domain-containing protein [Parapontixanthobacter aurantiacus]
MAYDNGNLEATISAAAGDNAALQGELATAFLDSIARQLDLLKRSRCDANWNMAALRLRAIAASFHAEQLVALADETLASAPGEPTVLRKMDAVLASFANMEAR